MGTDHSWQPRFGQRLPECYRTSPTESACGLTCCRTQPTRRFVHVRLCCSQTKRQENNANGIVRTHLFGTLIHICPLGLNLAYYVHSLARCGPRQHAPAPARTTIYCTDITPTACHLAAPASHAKPAPAHRWPHCLTLQPPHRLQAGCLGRSAGRASPPAAAP